MRNNTPDQSTPEQEQSEEQAQLRKEQSPLPTQDSDSSVVGSDAPPDSAPAKQDSPAGTAAETDPQPDQKILRAEKSEENAAQPSGSETADNAETPLAIQPDAAPTQPETLSEQEIGPSDAEQKTEAEGTPDQAVEEEPDQKPEQETKAAPPAEDTPTPSKCFGTLSWITPLILFFLTVLLFAPLAYNSKVAGIAPASKTSAQLAAAIEAAEQGSDLSLWIIPHVAGQPAPEVLPLQLWWGAAMKAAAKQISALTGDWLGGLVGPFILAWLFLMGTACLGWTDSRFKRKAALAAGIAAFCSSPFIAAAWFAPEVILGPALSVMAAACLLRSLKKPTFCLTMFLGCALMALAALAGGIILAALPLVAALLAIIGTLNFRRLGEWDLVFGLGLTTLILGGWLTGGLLFAGSSALRAYLALTPLLAGGGCALPESSPGGLALLFTAALLPWLALPALMPVRSCKTLLAGVKSWKDRSRFTEALFLAGLLVAGAAGLAVCSIVHPALLLALSAAVAALAARSLTNLSSAQNNRWGAFCALYLLALAAVFFWMLLDSGRELLNAQLGIAPNISFDLKVWLAPGAAALIGALTMWFFGRGKSSQTSLLALLFAALLITQAFAWFSIPVMEPYLKTISPEPPVMDIVAPGELNLGPDGPRLHIPMPPELPVITPPAVASQNATQIPDTQLDILGAPMPARHNATRPNALPGIGPEISINATTPAPESGLPGGEVDPNSAQNATAPVPEAGGALYGDDLPALDVPTGPPPAPYQPGLHPQAKEPPLPVLDVPGSASAPRAPLIEPYPPGNAD